MAEVLVGGIFFLLSTVLLCAAIRGISAMLLGVAAVYIQLKFGKNAVEGITNGS